MNSALLRILFLQVILVKWNEPYQKLASCDSSGVIFVWIKYEGRWSIELINDRSTPAKCSKVALCYSTRNVKKALAVNQRMANYPFCSIGFTVSFLRPSAAKCSKVALCYNSRNVKKALAVNQRMANYPFRSIGFTVSFLRPSAVRSHYATARAT
ncbi:Uncharacterized protein OBRU01_09858 [Operophtera brumata]|uniref:Secreted protein n=1 Tax=Operophtera brumata TaxID=104452 RepID=A0A0L7LFH0_OPEBR|nr:Uncharacterized protein OBRU01_09858 [Operophtera brumata]